MIEIRLHSLIVTDIFKENLNPVVNPGSILI